MSLCNVVVERPRLYRLCNVLRSSWFLRLLQVQLGCYTLFWLCGVFQVVSGCFGSFRLFETVLVLLGCCRLVEGVGNCFTLFQDVLDCFGWF